MNWSPEMWTAHHTLGQILVGWLVQLPICFLILLYFAATVESFVGISCQAWGYDLHGRFTAKAALKVVPVVGTVLALQAIMLIVLVLGLLELTDGRRT